MNRLVCNFCVLAVMVAAVGANAPTRFADENDDIYENTENDIIPEKRGGLDPLSGITFGGHRKRFDFDGLRGHTFGSQKRDAGVAEQEHSKLRGLIRKNKETVGSNGFYEDRHVVAASDSGRSAFVGLPKNTYYQQSIPLPLYYRLRDRGI